MSDTTQISELRAELDAARATIAQDAELAGVFQKRAEAAEARAAEWCNLAMTIVGELRLDYAPLEKTELDGEAMAHDLRIEVAKHKRLTAEWQARAARLASQEEHIVDLKNAALRYGSAQYLSALEAEHEELRPRSMTRIESRDWLERLHKLWRAVEDARQKAEER